ncbi:MAG: flippase [Ignavibacteriaceae bacterium]|nr:flippase [Ignavibacteriaceae bacterium]
MSSSTKINFRSEAFSKYFKNTGWLLGEKVIRILFGFTVNILLVRYLGAEEFGVFSYALSFVGIFAALATLGLDSIITREIVNHPEDKQKILGSVFLLRLSGAVIAFILICITLFITGETSLNAFFILVLSAGMFFQSFYVIEFFFHAQVKGKLVAIVQSISLITASLLKILFIYLQAPLIYFVIFQIVEILLIAIGLVIVFQKSDENIFVWKFNKSIAKRLLIDAWPLTIAGVVIGIYMKIDQIMIEKMLNSKELGYYASAVRLCEVWYFIPMVISTSLFPAILNAKKIDNNLYNSRLQKLYDLMAFISIAIAVPVTFLSPWIMTTLYGEEFLLGATVLTIYIWAGVPTFLGVASSQFLISENLTKISFYRTLAGMIANVALNFLLIPKYGINGAASATLVSYSIATFSIGMTKQTYNQLGMMLRSIFFFSLIKSVGINVRKIFR